MTPDGTLRLRCACAPTSMANTGRDTIVIRGARQNNLKNLSLELPTNELIVVTGVSGSGKSSLVFDTRSEERRVGKECRL